jgi:exodeoxyribonuclease VII large subunit
VQVVDRRSQYQLVVDRVDLSGVGELFAEYQKLKERLTTEGLFEAKRKRSVPSFPKYIVLVSARGKGAEDFEHVIEKSGLDVRVQLMATRVQGLNAEAEVAQAIDDASKLQPDAIVVARGGGSYEDLFTFNREAVVRAIVRATVPVITGIAHTADHHPADDVADLVFETPRAAGEYIVSLWLRGSERLERLTMRIERAMNDVLTRNLQRAEASADRTSLAQERMFSTKRERLVQLTRRLDVQSPLQRHARRVELFAGLRARLDSALPPIVARTGLGLAGTMSRLDRAMPGFIERFRYRLEKSVMHLELRDPNEPLSRGYALISLDGHLVRSSAEVSKGDRIEAQVAHGKITALVEGVSNE